MSFEDVDDFTEEGWARTLASINHSEEGDERAWENGGNRQGNGKPKYQHKENRGSVIENDHKTKETQPDFSGSINVNGKIFWINGWKQLTQSGKKQMSLSVQPQEERQPQQGGQPKRASW